MAQAGCYYVYIGFESVSPTVLKCFDKRQSVEQMVHAIGEFHDRGIRIHGMFIFGADHDTRATFRETVRFAKAHHIESAQFMILVPLPGTPVFDEMDREGRLLSRDWSLYDAHHVVFQPKNMSTFELQARDAAGLLPVLLAGAGDQAAFPVRLFLAGHQVVGPPRGAAVPPPPARITWT